MKINPLGLKELPLEPMILYVIAALCIGIGLTMVVQGAKGMKEQALKAEEDTKRD